MGPTTKLLSMSPEVGDPGRRDCDFVTMADGYKDEALGLVKGGVDLLVIETITDTLNAKAALWGVWEAFDALGMEVPLWISGTITDRSGRTLSGQTVEAFYNSVRHAKPWAVGLNCALGPDEMRPFLADLARVAECAVGAYPNAGLPNAMGGYDETPCSMETHYAEWARAGLVNILGGCCGTTPEHIKHLAHCVEGVKPRAIPQHDTRMRSGRTRTVHGGGVSSTETNPFANFVIVGERTNVTGSAKFRKLIEADDYPGALVVARQQVEIGRERARCEHGRGADRRPRVDDAVSQPHRLRTRHRENPADDRLFQVGSD